MNSSHIGRIEKSRRYAEEPERVTILSFAVFFRGENDDHVLSFEEGKWRCNCHSFSRSEECVHIMTLQRLLGKMLPGQSGISGQV